MASMLQQYMQNYGPRLQSQLAPSTAAAGTVNTQPVVGDGLQTSALGTNPGAPLQTESGAPSEIAAAPSAQAQPVQSALQPAAADEEVEDGEWSFKAQWQQMPDEQKQQQTDKLEQVLQKGGRTIDSAFDDMVAQLGARPSGKLSRQDKGMLIMELGLSLMAASARTRSLGGAIGAAGLQTLGSFQQKTQGRQQQYDTQKQAINAERTKAKSRLAEEVATGEIRGLQTEAQETARTARSEAQDAARASREANNVAGTITSEDGSVYGYTRGGKTSALTNEKGQPIKERQSEPLVPVQHEDGTVTYEPRSEARGKKRPTPTSQLDKPFSMKATDTNSIYRQAAGLFGGMYDPMTGRIGGLNREQAQTVQGIASRASQIYMEGGGEVDHATAVDQAYKERRSGGASKSGAVQLRQFTSEQDVQAALQRGEVQPDEIVVVNGKRFRIQQ